MWASPARLWLLSLLLWPLPAAHGYIWAWMYSMPYHAPDEAALSKSSSPLAEEIMVSKGWVGTCPAAFSLPGLTVGDQVSEAGRGLYFSLCILHLTGQPLQCNTGYVRPVVRARDFFGWEKESEFLGSILCSWEGVSSIS